ncbi:MAG: hypothetical protein CM1200mP14_01210 [Gammaproteobacteria bacterium]|nr:MAG: hypothetical protein CM1200mP14_01210 [Gammaproteobacteria bacterium]
MSGSTYPISELVSGTFQLLSQVAGRAGRGKLGGEVLIQTSLPDHYAIQAAVAHDFRAFAERESPGA